MAYVNIFSSEQQHQSPFSSCPDPRISFSNGLEAKHEIIKYKEAPVSSDFEFCVKNYSMIPADQIFFEGVILPLKDDGNGEAKKMPTLREELRENYGFEDSSRRKTKGSSWWRERFGLRSKKDQKRVPFVHQ